MPLLNLRDLVAFPSNGANDSDTVLAGVHFNTTALRYWNYTLYSNKTISNGSSCYLIFGQYVPDGIMANGSWVNATSCYVPIRGIGERGKLGVAFAVLFAATIMFTLLNLKKHGQQFLHEEKRFRLVGRRWQWYWMLFTAGCGIISCITSIDEDRDYLQEIAIVLQTLFFMLMVPGTLAMVWEGTRHWGSWQERQIVDVDPFSLPDDDRRARTEFYLPLIFYMFAWLNFFMTVPRGWSAIEMQGSPELERDVAAPAATDARFKLAGVFAALAYIVILYSLSHSLYHYKRSGGSWWRRLDAAFVHTPPHLFLALAVLAIKVAYTLASAWEWNISLMKYDGAAAWPYGLGYAPTALIIIILNVAGRLNENEDLQLLAQRRARGAAADRDLGLTKKPAWWNKMSAGMHLTPEERLRALTTEVRGNAPRPHSDVELRAMDHSNNPDAHYRRDTDLAASVLRRDSEISAAAGLRDRSRSRPGERNDPFRDTSPADAPRGRDSEREARLGIRPGADAGRADSTASTQTAASAGSGSTLAGARPQRIRSMLNV